MTGRPPARGVMTPAEFEVYYDYMVCALCAAIRRDPGVASAWKAANASGRMGIIAEALRGPLGPRYAREPKSSLCFLCLQTTEVDDPVFVIGSLAVCCCSECVTRAKSVARRN